ncbi:type II secretion system secretin GspD [Candidatus Magnetobacterium casense]|uniref:Type II secretion system secretin GspD n=1 Tax=Candidatus Magnetobacterium casense TaxID=1455061 RepID=A0ABS6RXD6_9BACT|nr:type II secretion system secretin GspD [Candidatus Magnetobacterium casensis]MBV6340473.1 type II secretion system secretin GspD [Candidatus Magnetobacterium casensis]
MSTTTVLRLLVIVLLTVTAAVAVEPLGFKPEAIMPPIPQGKATVDNKTPSQNPTATVPHKQQVPAADNKTPSQNVPPTTPRQPTPAPVPTKAPVLPPPPPMPLTIPAPPITQTPPTPPPHMPPLQNNISLFFDDADIFEIVHTVFGEIMKVNYLIDPRVKGRITFKTTAPVAGQDLLPIVSTVFRLNGVSVMQEKGLYRIIPLSDISKEPVPVNFGRNSKDVNIMGLSLIQIVPLNFVGSKEMKDILTPFLSNGATIAEVAGRNVIVISDTDENMKRLLQIVEIFDDDVFREVKVEMFVFKNLNIKDALEELKSAFPLLSAPSKEGLKIKYLTIERLNAILVIAPNDEYIHHFRKWVSVIDTVFEGSRPKVYVYPLQNSDANHVVEILGQILSDSGGSSKKTGTSSTPTPAATPAPSPGGFGQKTSTTTTSTTTAKAKAITASASSFVSHETRIFYDEKTNSLIILALPKDYMFIEDLIKKIDIVPRQVLIEAMIIEVQLNKGLEFGVEWYLNSSFGGKDKNLDSWTASYGTNILSFDPAKPMSTNAFTFAALNANQAVQGLLQMLSSKSTVNILSSPHILVADNKEAKIQVGNQVAIATSETNVSGTTNIQRTIQYKDTGVILKVKPHINDSGLVNLEVTQEVSDVGASSSNIDSPTISTRNISTNMIVQDGKSIVMGGMIQESTDNTGKGIPLLSDIPILGYLFGYHKNTVKKTELIVIITPRVVKSIDDAVKMTEDFKGKLTGLQKSIKTYEDKSQPEATPKPEETPKTEKIPQPGETIKTGQPPQ